MRETLDGDAETRAVHHHEHGRQPAMLLADQPALGAVVIEDGGRVAVDAHLVLDRAADDAVALAGPPSASGRNFGTRKSEMPLTPAGAPSMRASTR